MKRILLVLVLSLIPCVGFGQTGGTETRVLGQHGAWEIGLFVDTFTDEPLTWYAGNALNEHNVILFMCWHRHRYYNFLAFADQGVLNPPVRTRIRVDDRPIVDMRADGPSQAFVPQENADMVLDQMRGGEEVRFRITKSGQNYTFRLSLEGFEGASDWVLQRCEVKPG